MNYLSCFDKRKNVVMINLENIFLQCRFHWSIFSIFCNLPLLESCIDKWAFTESLSGSELSVSQRLVLMQILV